MNKNESYTITNPALIGFIVTIGILFLIGIGFHLDLKVDFHNLADKVSVYNDKLIKLETQIEYLISKNID